MPPEGALIATQNGMVDGALMAPQNGLVEGEGVPPNSVEGYQYEEGPTIDAEYAEIHTVMADGGDRSVFLFR